MGTEQDTSSLTQVLGFPCRRYEVGGGVVEPAPAGPGLRFTVAQATRRSYVDAQVDDYHWLPRRRFPWRPPLQMTVRARFSHPVGALHGTAGFGLWNDPFMMTGARMPTLPRAVWFFYGSPPSNMKLDLETPGHGWKAATIDAFRPAAVALAPLALPAMVLMNVPAIYRRLWPPIQRALHVAEVPIETDLTAWHTYRLEWGDRHARFLVDGAPVLEEAPAPRGPLGFVAWLDNQYLVATPQGRFRWGLLDVPGPQWMEVERVEIVIV